MHKPSVEAWIGSKVRQVLGNAVRMFNAEGLERVSPVSFHYHKLSANKTGEV